jgi:antitoxin (DNA-binding transcriptional repressor) of toxin-antitoxin stability system
VVELADVEAGGDVDVADDVGVVAGVVAANVRRARVAMMSVMLFGADSLVVMISARWRRSL